MIDKTNTILSFIIDRIEPFYFYHQNIEVDFYIPTKNLAVQVSYSLKEETTRKREITALLKIAKVMDVEKLLIITHDEEEMIVEDGKEIAVVPIWKWLLEQDSLLENR
ncbi:hypothetical protein [uncultured Parabacteroides sp.]|uniref:hypothetical protein n=1 Tax=uncultured Parabacteroides sp. TaxID=512312 RepID=UPI002591A872|nr:hypothetical protein [uncultured Parabacteroides sp.]